MLDRESQVSLSLGIGRLQRLIALRSFGAYANLPAEDVAALAEIAVERRWEAGDHILNEGEAVTHLHFVIEGEVELRRQGLMLRRFGPQSVVGGVAALAEDPEGYDAVALEPTVTLEVSASENEELFEEHPEILSAVLGAITGQIVILRRELGPTAGFKSSTWIQEGSQPEPLDFVGRMAALRDALPFAGTRLEALADLARDVRELRLDDGETLWEEGEQADACVFILWGTVEVRMPDYDDAIVFGPGDVVGSLSMIGMSHRWYSARVPHGLVGLRLNGEALRDVLEDHFDLLLSMVRVMSRGLLDLTVEVAKVHAEAGQLPPTRF